MQSLIGFFLIPFIALCFSSNPDRIQIRPLLFGFIVQVSLGIVCLKFPLGKSAMESAVSAVQNFLSFSNVGAEFVFGASYQDHFIAFSVMPIILYVSAAIAILFYIGFIPAFMKGFNVLTSTMVKFKLFSIWWPFFKPTWYNSTRSSNMHWINVFWAN